LIENKTDIRYFIKKIPVRIIRSNLFEKFPGLVFGFSTKEGAGLNPEYNLKMFFNEMGIKEEQVTFQKQIHSDVINYSRKPQYFDGCDALYTDKKNNFLAVRVADCIPVFLYEPERKIIAGIHSGWKGTHGKILTKTIEELVKRFDIDISKLNAYIGPGISQDNYEVGKEVGELFDDDVKYFNKGKWFLDLKKDNHNQLIQAGAKKENIEVSGLCTFNEKDLLHSYRRDGLKAGRMLGVIGMR
jgi:purine-nucleoside/S-methyl-5'-thioadenosine phosphorylase / adenosine deaminase